MNYYERIQRSIDFIEGNLTAPIPLETAASAAFLSLAHYYRMFHALAGHSLKDYIRKRRLSEAGRKLVETDQRIIDLALDYQFESQESFTRAFKAFSGTTPAQYRKTGGSEKLFPRLDLMDQYFRSSPESAIDPTIKVLKELSPIRVAYYRAVSETPEHDAFTVLLRWAEAEGLMSSDNPYRIFGFNNPSPRPGEKVYGYEAWITVDVDVKPSGPVTIKEFGGGLYAVTGTLLSEIEHTWRNFDTWLKISRYSYGSHQWLEEHLTPPWTPDAAMQIDLYLPLRER